MIRPINIAFAALYLLGGAGVAIHGHYLGTPWGAVVYFTLGPLFLLLFHVSMPRYLSAKQIAALAHDPSRYRSDTPAGEPAFCAYCGNETKAGAYTDLRTGTSYPPCCWRPACLDKWEPISRRARDK